jgi:hypothetical protein
VKGNEGAKDMSEKKIPGKENSNCKTPKGGVYCCFQGIFSGVRAQ